MSIYILVAVLELRASDFFPPEGLFRSTSGVRARRLPALPSSSAGSIYVGLTFTSFPSNLHKLKEIGSVPDFFLMGGSPAADLQPQVPLHKVNQTAKSFQ